MKKLNKLQINSERLMKNDELVTLRGGYGSIACYEWGSGNGLCGGAIKGYINGPCSEALYMCVAVYHGACVTC